MPGDEAYNVAVRRLRSEWRSADAPDDKCVVWWGLRNGAGYGKMHALGVGLYAHRVAWVMRNGKIPSGMCVLHRCDRTECVNPKHLFLGTHADNVLDMVTKGRQAAGMKNGQAKLRPEQVREIRRTYIPRRTTLKQLAERYGISEAAVSLVVNRLRWRTIPG